MVSRTVDLGSEVIAAIAWKSEDVFAAATDSGIVTHHISSGSQTLIEVVDVAPMLRWCGDSILWPSCTG